MLILQAPAKLNLTLEVLAKREDGYHEIRSVVQTIGLGDTLHFRLSRDVQFGCDKPDWYGGESLVSRVVTLLQEVTGCTKGVVIDINKRIPLVSGLGGDSSDAAAMLRGLNILWELGLSQLELFDLAMRLGSDVAFFLYGGTALMEGRGELITSLPAIPTMWVALVMPSIPPMPRKTERLYNSLNQSHYTDGQITDRVVTCITTGEELTPPMLFNVFDAVAVASFSGLEECTRHFLRAGARTLHLAGSGPALFTLTRDKAQAEAIYHYLQQQGLETYLVETISGIEIERLEE